MLALELAEGQLLGPGELLLLPEALLQALPLPLLLLSAEGAAEEEAEALGLREAAGLPVAAGLREADSSAELLALAAGDWEAQPLSESRPEAEAEEL